MQMMRKWAAVLVLFAGLSAFGAYKTHNVGQGEAVDLTATGNTADDIYICQGGNTFTLTGTAAADGSFAVKAPPSARRMTLTARRSPSTHRA